MVSGLGICGVEAVAEKFVPTRRWRQSAFIARWCSRAACSRSRPWSAHSRKPGINALPVFVSSLKDPVSVETLRALFSRHSPDIVLNATGFAVGSLTGAHEGTVLDETGAMVLQVILSGGTREAWEASSQGLATRDLAMNVALPEVDGRVLSRAVAFKHAGAFDERVQATIVSHRADDERCEFVAGLAANWARLRRTDPSDRKVALVLANYPNRDGRLANGVGLDTPAGTVEVLKALRAEGYQLGAFPEIRRRPDRASAGGPTNSGWRGREVREKLQLADYFNLSMRCRTRRGRRFSPLGRAAGRSVLRYRQPVLRAAAGALRQCPCRRAACARLQHRSEGNATIRRTSCRRMAISPSISFAQCVSTRSCTWASTATWNGCPARRWRLSSACFPEAVLGPMPHLYPFIVNDPGEGTQAKRRSAAVIIDHLTPPLTRAESYGPLRDLEALVDEYYEASGSDPRRLKLLAKQILERVELSGLGEDIGLSPRMARTTALPSSMPGFAI